jgi:hypothetical protein
MSCCRPGVLERCVRCGGRQTTRGKKVSRCLLSGCCWGRVTKDRVEYDVGRHSCSVVELVAVICFFVDLVFLYGVEYSSFFSGMQDGRGLL